MTQISAKYERLIEDLRQDFRPQREWGEGRGVFLAVGHFLVGIAGGGWLFGLLFDHAPTLAASFLLAGAGGVAHLAFLGRPERFWKMARHVRTAWISRGFIGLTAFLVGAALYLPPLLVDAWPWGAASWLGRFGWALALVGMAVLIVYMGFVYTASKGVPFWNSPLHPVLYMAYALRGGAAGMLVTMAMLGEANEAVVGTLIEVWLAVTAVVAVLFALELHGAMTGGNAAARRSAHDLLAGRLAALLYIGVLSIGLVVPAVLVSGTIAPLTIGVLAVIGLCSTLGDFFMKYASIRAGVYLPLRAVRERTR
jgi:formate-dependent nitrite reductase membrane component NrfD